MTDVLDRHEWKFTYVPKSYDTLTSKNTQDVFRKWDMAECQVATFAFDTTYRRGMSDDFLASFFNSAEVRSVIRFTDETGFNANLGKKSVKDVSYQPLDCTKVRLDMFDKLYDAGVVRENGSIAKMMDRFLPAGVTVSDELRGYFMDPEESDHAELFTEEEKNEFLYHVMWRIVSGGAMCQYEDDFSVYKNMVRGVYKDLVSVQKSATGGIEAVSHIYMIKDLTPLQLYGRPGFDNHNFCYVSVNPVLRQVHFWYNAFASPF
eukprot:TRINITY_DN8789_c0_g1_i1.p1 TRINITY_DN8789_c0_g1~~TRINITY_DN8789_c0_g1_i1.p1  ORF type:complete len:262 (+),score=118.51 TRINITY_DN8789_c0_g1_i1:282-1067(+)